jgi:hypothetical protein
MLIFYIDELYGLDKCLFFIKSLKEYVLVSFRIWNDDISSTYICEYIWSIILKCFDMVYLNSNLI